MASQFSSAGQPDRAGPYRSDNRGSSQYSSAAGHDQAGPYRSAYQASQFDTEKLPAPVRVAAPPTSAFEHAPVRGAPDGGGAKAVGHTPPSAAYHNEEESPYPPTSTGAQGYGTPLSFGLAVADVVLRSLASLCAVIALGLLAVFSSDIDSLNSILGVAFSTASPKYALAITIIGTIYSLIALISAIVRLVTGKLLLPSKISHLLFYIGDQVFMGLLLTAGSAGASYLTALSCSGESLCGKGAGGVAMIFFAFVFIAASSIFSTFCLYKKRT